jgi:hypothetical protein
MDGLSTTSVELMLKERVVYEQEKEGGGGVRLARWLVGRMLLSVGWAMEGRFLQSQGTRLFCTVPGSTPGRPAVVGMGSAQASGCRHRI